jgi:polyribonucleotide nucleotidyltransferase
MSPSSPREFRRQIAGKEMVLSVGVLAPQANAAVTCRVGDTLVLGTVVMNDSVREGIDYMPLLVEYEEKFYAAGKIKGSRFVKREGRPTDIAVTTSRMVDRSIRPLFPKRMRNDVHVVTTVLSYDGENAPDVPAMVAASAALTISRVPWDGPLGAVRIGRKNGTLIVNPAVRETQEETDLDLIVAASATEAVMLEAGGKEIPEADMITAIDLGTKEAGVVAAFLAEVRKEIGVPKVKPILAPLSDDISAKVRAAATKDAEAILREGGAKLAVEEKFAALEEKVIADLKLSDDEAKAASNALGDLHRDIVREWIIAEGRRLNNRKAAEVRPLRVEVGVVPRAHGSALFERGETQILSIVTLGSPDDAMILDTMTEEDRKKRYMHFYNMPAFSVGEIAPNRGPGRRDIGHGALAEKALTSLLPAKEQFPYTVMVVSEVLASNGSSSMGSACGSSLALMDAGVPIPRPVAGIAMGLVTDETQRGRAPVVLTDIAGMEDEGCDMDFKVAGTEKGITALQVDIKTHGLSADVVRQAVEGARTARLQILEAMNAVLGKARPELSKYAPRILALQINPEKIKDLIGPRGKHINQIIEETNVDIDVEDSGLVMITAKDPAAMAKAKEWVENLTREVQPGERFSGRVTRIMKFGAFVEILPGTEGLVHISELANHRVNRVEDVVHVGQVIPVIVTEIDQMGRVNLSHKRAQPE